MSSSSNKMGRQLYCVNVISCFLCHGLKANTQGSSNKKNLRFKQRSLSIYNLALPPKLFLVNDVNIGQAKHMYRGSQVSCSKRGLACLLS